MSESMKRCTKCREVKPLTEFWRDATSKDGHAWNCKACMRARKQAWREANRERDRFHSRLYKANHREHVREYDRQYTRENRATCPKCGHEYGIGSGTQHGPASRVAFSHCPGCKKVRRQTIQRMWAEGATIRDIAVEIGTTVRFVRVDIHRMRDEGWDVPYRYRRRIAA